MTHALIVEDDTATRESLAALVMRIGTDHRPNVFPLEIAPLRSRGGDDADLHAQSVLEEMNQACGTRGRFAPGRARPAEAAFLARQRARAQELPPPCLHHGG